jgi:two-component system, cell cycle sensor histidine kinase and response regulator CckA
MQEVKAVTQADMEPNAAAVSAIPGAKRGNSAEQRLQARLMVFVVGAMAILTSLVTSVMELRIVLMLIGLLLFVAAGVMTAISLRRSSQRQILMRAVGSFVAHDGWPSFVTDAEGMITSRNAAAMERFQDTIALTLTDVFKDMFANPGGVLFRLQGRAVDHGVAREDVVTRRGHLRLSAHRIESNVFLWRIEDMAERAGSGRGADALSLPMLTAGPSGTILFMNEAFRRLTGGRARTLDKVFLDLPLGNGRVHSVEGTEGPIDCLVAEVQATGGRREIYLLPSAAAGPNARNEATGWDAIEDLPVPLLKVAATGEVLASNREARALLPMPISATTRLSDLLEGLGRPIIEWLRETAEGRGAPGPQFLRGTGAHQDTFVQVSLNLAGSKEDPHLIAVLNDVTELKSLEAQFVQSQKMQAIGQLAGGVAHDFNNLLTAISGHCDLLLLRHDQGDQDYGDLIQIHQNANRAASLVGQLLAFSRKQNLMPEVIDLRDTLSDLTHLLNRLVGEKVTLTLNHDPALLHIRADKRQLEQVLMNLVVNARDAMPDGGEIRVETENVTLLNTVERDRATLLPGQLCGGARGRRRHRHRTRETAQDLRAVLHHQAAGRGHRAWPVDRLRYRQADRRLHLCRQRRGPRHHLHPLFPEPREGRTSRRPRAQAGTPRHRHQGRGCGAAGRGRGAGAGLCLAGADPARLFRPRGGQRGGGPDPARRPDPDRRHLCDRRDHARQGRPDLGARGAGRPARYQGGLRVGLCRGRLHRTPGDDPQFGVPAQAVLADRPDRNGAAAVALTRSLSWWPAAHESGWSGKSSPRKPGVRALAAAG